MKILIIEDDEDKCNQIISFLQKEIPSIQVSEARSYQTGLESIISNAIDLILLDMSMPTFDIGMEEDGGRPQAYAGREILRQMNRRKIETPITVITQFDKFGEGDDELELEELDRQLRKEHPNYLGTIYYNASLTEWKRSLIEIISSVTENLEASY